MREQPFDNLSRRSFLSAAIAGTGALAIWPQCLQASGKKLQSLSFIVVTDTHLGYRDKEHAAQQWGKTAVEIAKADGNLVLHLGDVVDGERWRQPENVGHRLIRTKPRRRAMGFGSREVGAAFRVSTAPFGFPLQRL